MCMKLGIQDVEHRLNIGAKHCSAKRDKVGQGRYRLIAVGRVHHGGCVYEVALA